MSKKIVKNALFMALLCVSGMTTINMLDTKIVPMTLPNQQKIQHILASLGVAHFGFITDFSDRLAGHRIQCNRLEQCVDGAYILYSSWYDQHCALVPNDDCNLFPDWYTPPALRSFDLNESVRSGGECVNDYACRNYEHALKQKAALIAQLASKSRYHSQ